MVFNVSSDVLMLFIPLPFIINSKLPPFKRAMLVVIFSLGIFVILAAVLNKYYNFSMPNTTVYMVWDIRETSTSICVANIMCWWPLLRKIFGLSTFLMGSAGSRSSGGGSRVMATPEPSAAICKLKSLTHRDEENVGYRNLSEGNSELQSSV
jgi:hypothetical protein